MQRTYHHTIKTPEDNIQQESLYVMEESGILIVLSSLSTRNPGVHSMHIFTSLHPYRLINKPDLITSDQLTPGEETSLQFIYIVTLLESKVMQN